VVCLDFIASERERIVFKMAGICGQVGIIVCADRKLISISEGSLNCYFLPVDQFAPAHQPPPWRRGARAPIGAG